MTVPSDVSLAQIEQAITQRGTGLEAWRRELANVETDLKGRASRRGEIPTQISAVQQILADVNNELQSPAPAEEASPVNSARRLMLLAKRRAAEEELLSYQRELAAAEARAEVLPLSRDLDARRIALGNRRSSSGRRSATNGGSRRPSSRRGKRPGRPGQADPAIKLLVDKNTRLADERKRVAQQITDATQQLHEVSNQLTSLQEQFQRTRERIEMVGLTSNNGMILRKQRETLPNLGVYRRNISDRQQTIREGQLHLWELQDWGSALADVDQQTQAVLQQLNWSKLGNNRFRLEIAVHEALTTQREYLHLLSEATSTPISASWSIWTTPSGN